jgi:ATP-binding cassette subfamily B protein
MLTLNLGIVGAVGVGGSLAIEGSLTLGEVVAAINYLLYAMFPMLMLAAMVGFMSSADASAGRILEVLDSDPGVVDAPADGATVSSVGRVAFEDVSFSYNGDGQEPVLKNVSFVAEPGETVAILGATGSGKSTLVHLVPRFYDVSEGRLLVDGVDVRQLPLDQLRSAMGIAMQDTVLFTGTIQDNIRYGRPDASDDEVRAAAEAAQAHDFIMGFPDGYDSAVGQRGVNLSGGQKQRLAIARALLVDPAVLILDDSTSSVDVETEARIQVALENLMEGRTSLVIAQRISTVLNADKIVVLDQGRVAAVGRHRELMASSPIYREIYDSQLGDGGADDVH